MKLSVEIEPVSVEKETEFVVISEKEENLAVESEIEEGQELRSKNSLQEGEVEGKDYEFGKVYNENGENQMVEKQEKL